MSDRAVYLVNFGDDDVCVVATNPRQAIEAAIEWYATDDPDAERLTPFDLCSLQRLFGDVVIADG